MHQISKTATKLVIFFKIHKLMYNYLIILNGKAIHGYSYLKNALNAYERLSILKNDDDFIELWSRKEGILKETY